MIEEIPCLEDWHQLLLVKGNRKKQKLMVAFTIGIEHTVIAKAKADVLCRSAPLIHDIPFSYHAQDFIAESFCIVALKIGTWNVLANVIIVEDLEGVVH